MSSPYVMVANTQVVREPRPVKKNRINRKGRDMKMSAIDEISVPDAAVMRTVVVTMAEEDAKTGSEEHLLENQETDLESIDILV